MDELKEQQARDERKDAKETYWVNKIRQNFVENLDFLLQLKSVEVGHRVTQKDVEEKCWLYKDFISKAKNDGSKYPDIISSIKMAEFFGCSVEDLFLTKLGQTDKFLSDLLYKWLQDESVWKELKIEKLNEQGAISCIKPFDFDDFRRCDDHYFDDLSEEDYEMLDIEGMFYDFELSEFEEEECESIFNRYLGNLTVYGNNDLRPINLTLDPVSKQVVVESSFLSDHCRILGSIFLLPKQNGKNYFIMRIEYKGKEYFELYRQEERVLTGSEFNEYSCLKKIKPICSSENSRIAKLLQKLYKKAWKSIHSPELSNVEMKIIENSL